MWYNEGTGGLPPVANDKYQMPPMRDMTVQDQVSRIFPPNCEVGRGTQATAVAEVD